MKSYDESCYEIKIGTYISNDAEIGYSFYAEIEELNIHVVAYSLESLLEDIEAELENYKNEINEDRRRSNNEYD